MGRRLEQVELHSRQVGSEPNEWGPEDANILTLGILAGLGRFQELGIYTNAARASGVTVDEIKDALTTLGLPGITINCGTPAGRQAFLAAHEPLKTPKD